VVTHAYAEAQLIERHAVGLFAELALQTVSAMGEVFGADGTHEHKTSDAESRTGSPISPIMGI